MTGFIRRNPRYALLLPLTELALWTATVGAPMLFSLATAATAVGHTPALRLGKHSWLLLTMGGVSEHYMHLVINLDLPGAIIGAPLTALILPQLRSAIPFAPQIWNTLTLPFFCLPVWWFIGRAIDSRRAACQIRNPALILGSIAFLACMAFAIGVLTAPANDRNDLLAYLPGALLWAISFAIFPVSWLRQRKSPRG